MRFNPPPNWPPPPPGWAPDGNWSPDPSWPPPPPGWPLWIDDFGQPYPMQPPTASRAGLRKTLWIALAAGTAAVIAVVAVFAAGVGGVATDAAGNHSAKADITELTRDLLVDKSAFPDVGDAKRSSGVGSPSKTSGSPDLSIDPQECAEFYGDSKSTTQTAYATMSTLDRTGPHSLEVRLSLSPQRLELADYLTRCRSFTASLKLGGRAVTFEASLAPLQVSGVPPWALATVMKSSGKPFRGIPLTISLTSGTISGYYRGVLVVARSTQFNPRGQAGDPLDSEATNDLVRLFNAEVDKLEAAP